MSIFFFLFCHENITIVYLIASANGYGNKMLDAHYLWAGFFVNIPSFASIWIDVYD
jgi:hypothetical protein